MGHVFGAAILERDAPDAVRQFRFFQRPADAHVAHVAARLLRDPVVRVQRQVSHRADSNLSRRGQMYSSCQRGLTTQTERIGEPMNKSIWMMSLAMVAGSAAAQEATPGQLDEVIVSADRRDENVRDVPSS